LSPRTPPLVHPKPFNSQLPNSTGGWKARAHWPLMCRRLSEQFHRLFAHRIAKVSDLFLPCVCFSWSPLVPRARQEHGNPSRSVRERHKHDRSKRAISNKPWSPGPFCLAVGWDSAMTRAIASSMGPMAGKRTLKNAAATFEAVRAPSARPNLTDRAEQRPCRDASGACCLALAAARGPAKAAQEVRKDRGGDRPLQHLRGSRKRTSSDLRAGSPVAKPFSGAIAEGRSAQAFALPWCASLAAG